MSTFPMPDLSSLMPNSAQTERPAALSKSPRQGDSEKETLRSSARQFEAMFIAEMLRLTPMAKGIGGAFSGGFGEEAARSFLIDAVAEDMVAQGGLGLSDDFLESMMRKDET